MLEDKVMSRKMQKGGSQFVSSGETDFLHSNEECSNKNHDWKIGLSRITLGNLGF